MKPSLKCIPSLIVLTYLTDPFLLCVAVPLKSDSSLESYPGVAWATPVRKLLLALKREQNIWIYVKNLKQNLSLSATWTGLTSSRRLGWLLLRLNFLLVYYSGYQQYCLGSCRLTFKGTTSISAQLSAPNISLLAVYEKMFHCWLCCALWFIFVCFFCGVWM